MNPDVPTTEPSIGLGCMRLSTDRDRDEATAIAVLHAAFDAGITLLDTADAYCWDDSERGHNERLIARALATWTGDRSRVRVATKGGFRRPDGRWESDGRAKHLAAACRESCRALGVERLHLYQLQRARFGIPRRVDQSPPCLRQPTLARSRSSWACRPRARAPSREA